MNLEQLTGRSIRLRQELVLAQQQEPAPSGLIERLVQDLETTEREISVLRARGQPSADDLNIATA
jgi:hypothetical protein